MEQLGRTVPGLPSHLAGVPSCLHKYEPLLLEAWLRRQPGAAGEGDQAGEAVA